MNNDKIKAINTLAYLAFRSRLYAKSRPWVVTNEIKHIADDIPDTLKRRMIGEINEHINDGIITDAEEIKEWTSLINKLQE